VIAAVIGVIAVLAGGGFFAYERYFSPAAVTHRAEQKFISDARSAFPDHDQGETDQQILTAGHTVCTALSQGVGRDEIVSRSADQDLGSSPSAPERSIMYRLIDLAVKDLCPGK
jgi:hypothetical protein